MLRRNVLKKMLSAVTVSGFVGSASSSPEEAPAVTQETKEPVPSYGMGIQVDRCIGCGRCVEACKTENNVPLEPHFVRTWIERYTIDVHDHTTVSLQAPKNPSSPEPPPDGTTLRSFFVPKLCNHCENPPCAQVCPVEATFKTEEGIVLVDKERCIGCGYCIQACPYGARYMHPEQHTADKCTFCYHRIKQDLLPACVEVCPTQTRVFGDRTLPASPLVRLKRMKKTHILKAHLNTEPKVFYTDLDGEVR